MVLVCVVWTVDFTWACLVPCHCIYMARSCRLSPSPYNQILEAWNPFSILVNFHFGTHNYSYLHVKMLMFQKARKQLIQMLNVNKIRSYSDSWFSCSSLSWSSVWSTSWKSIISLLFEGF